MTGFFFCIAWRTLPLLRAMLHVLGLEPFDPAWAGSHDGSDLADIVDGLVQLLLEQRAQARARKDWAAADAIRDQLTALGLTIADTADGARWSR